MGDEDKRVAIGFSVTLSTQLISAALAMLAIQGALVSFALEKREFDEYFTALAVVAALAFLASIFFGGKAITASRDAGLVGNWSAGAGKGLYDWQAKFALLGLVAFGAAVMATAPRKDGADESRLEHIESRLDRLTNRLKLIEEAKGEPPEALNPISESLRNEETKTTRPEPPRSLSDNIRR